MNLRNKTVLFWGDSITEGVGASSPEKIMFLFLKN